jgi:hypothetical protein
MGVDFQRAMEALRSHLLPTLFVEYLGWEAPVEPLTIATKLANQTYRLQAIAQRGQMIVWEIRLPRTSQIHAKLKDRLYSKACQHAAQALIIVNERSHQRSLWFWYTPWQQQLIAQSVVFVSGQPDEFWLMRLKKLAAYQPTQTTPFNLLPDWLDSSELSALKTGFDQCQQELCEHLSGISHSGDRQRYAHLLLVRLLAIYLLQRRGLLGNGDLWYLHNKFGQVQQQGPNRFFQQFLQPLFAQGFALPESERPLSTQQLLGAVPFMGNVFQRHALEQQYPHINIADAPFETFLMWLGEPIWPHVLNPWRSASLNYLLEPSLPALADPILVEQTCSQSLHRFILNTLTPAPIPDTSTLNDLLFHGGLPLCRQLIQDVLPQVKILDPACRHGTFLLAALQHLVEIYCVLLGHLRHQSDTQLDLWLSGLQSEHEYLLQAIYRRLLKHHLYGVDLRSDAVAITQVRLMMSLIATAPTPTALQALPTLDFNILTGNSLVGLIRVNAEGFDRVKPKPRPKGELAQADTLVLQGNLLQPLAASSYRAILIEKNISLENYQAQLAAFQEVQAIPVHAQLEFLHEHILSIDRSAQSKLNELLLTEFSYKLGIQFKETQLTEKPQPRLLSVNDLELLTPLHWGYYFNAIIEEMGGFSVMLSALPWGSFKPSVEDFFQRFSDIASLSNHDVASFKTSKSALKQADPAVAQAWLFYQSQFSFIRDYFYRADQYQHQSPTIDGRKDGRKVRSQLYLDWLFTEQCLTLLRPQGTCALLLPDTFLHHPHSAALRQHLQTSTQQQQIDPLENSDNNDPKHPQFCLLSFQKQ